MLCVTVPSVEDLRTLIIVEHAGGLTLSSVKDQRYAATWSMPFAAAKLAIRNIDYIPMQVSRNPATLARCAPPSLIHSMIQPAGI